MYYQSHNRIRAKSRGALVGLIHGRCLRMRDGIYDGAAAVTHTVGGHKSERETG
jgi:ATP-binding cassette subfamily C (CFTR/MRP) protein 1